MNGGVTHGDESWPERGQAPESSQPSHRDVTLLTIAAVQAACTATRIQQILISAARHRRRLSESAAAQPVKIVA